MPVPDSHAVSTVDLCKSYTRGNGSIVALYQVNLTIPASQFLFISGKSGSGKSSLLNLLGCLDEPSSGSICLFNSNLRTMTRRHKTLLRRNRLGFIFQNYNLIPTLTALENVTYVLKLNKQEEAHERAVLCLERLGLGSLLHTRPAKMSGGQQQRISIARALASNPDMILADEPTGNLDTNNSQQVLSELRRICDVHQKTIIVVSHDRTVRNWADREIILEDGRIVMDERIKDARM